MSPENTIDAGLLAGSDNSLPARAKDPQELMLITHRTNVQLQRSAKQLMGRLKRLKLFGPMAESRPEARDQLIVQLLFEMRDALKSLDDIEDLDARQQMLRVIGRMNGLKAMAAAHQQALSEVNKITGNTNRTLLEVARLKLLTPKNDDDDITDAELLNAENADDQAAG